MILILHCSLLFGAGRLFTPSRCSLFWYMCRIATRKIPNFHLSEKHLTQSEHKKTIAPHLALSALRTGRNPNIVKLRPRQTWTGKDDELPNSQTRGGGGGGAATTDIKLDILPGSTGSTGSGASAGAGRAAAAGLKSWRLPTDVMSIVFRFAGPSATAKVGTRVSKAWRELAQWQRLVPLWWLDATGEKLVTGSSTDGGGSGGSGSGRVSALKLDEMMRVLSQFDSRHQSIHEVTAYVSPPGASPVIPVQFFSFDFISAYKPRQTGPDRIDTLITVVDMLTLYVRCLLLPSLPSPETLPTLIDVCCGVQIRPR